MGVFDSKSDKAGGQVGSSDSVAYDNKGSNAPVINFTDERKASGKSVHQYSNELSVNVSTTDYGAIDLALDFARSAGNLIEETLRFGADANAEFLGEVGDFASLSASTAERMAELSDRQSERYLSEVSNQANANREFLEDANANLATAYQANNTRYFDAVGQNAQFTQKANEKALDYVFQSSKSESERITGDVIKWGSWLAIAVISAPVLKQILVRGRA